MSPLPVALPGAPAGTRLRRATGEDLPDLVALLADDPLGRTRESAADDLEPYRSAFALIDADPDQMLVVADAGNGIVATLQLALLPGLSRRGALRAQVAGVRVRADQRGKGTGGALMSWVIEEARSRGCALVQLTTDASRADAHRFYERLGFRPSHVGFELPL
ncbi:MAG: family N-acetyltransferase [Blastococcus sp.]|nr:family N-acetyltransferase [Blastococcus sp.]